MKIAIVILFSTTIIGLILSPSMKITPLMPNQISESVMMIILGLSLIGVARILRAESIRI